MPTANNTRALWPLLVIVVAVLAAGGCSTSTTTSGLSLVNEQGNHPPGWISSHPTYALPAGSLCGSCHGSVTNASQSGGISGVSCFLASRSGQGCHAGGPTFLGIHAVPFPAPEHFQATDNTFSAVCANCHGIDPPSPLATAPACTTCHGEGLTGSITGKSPLTLLNCTSCHAEPPAGTAYPNIAGAHAIHLGLDNTLTPVSCDTCHTGLGSGTQAHYDQANARVGKNALRVPPGDAAFGVTYNAKSGAPSFDNTALACTNVSCHGGQTTPDWRTGTIDPNTDCLLCHAAGTTQFNGFSSGRHNTHVQFWVPSLLPSVVPTCLACHNTTTLAVSHYTAFSTPAMEGPASATIGGAGTSLTSYTPGAPGTGSCTPQSGVGCHGTRDW